VVPSSSQPLRRDHRDFAAKGTESMQVSMEGMKPSTLRAGLRRALKDREGEGVKLAQRGEDTYLVRAVAREGERE